ncbi:phage tail tape measure protein [Photorhabdus tasmaniensis]|uniref:Phage tail tape measure protein n=1 Tax=Photorhabdus tasmaniensis TaxID=1004159 RepID=A0ABX0GF98_9GAMM|nr:phage tail tape measure protein [Photorhabdus tasmaniensis]NHB87192.1 phage tail tape measure protein [Photorhabdus tasmaniensis]
MKELSFLLSLKNNLSAPLGRAQQSVEQFAKKSQESFQKIAVGAAGLWGVSEGMKALLSPAQQVRSALDELSTRNVSTQSLDKVYRASLAFSTAYGKSAAEFVASATVIKGTIAGLTDVELPRYTTAINTLAVATKTSADEAATYMTSLVKRFDSTVRQIGQVPFAEMMASKTAYMTRNFGSGMSDIQAMLESAPTPGKLNIGMDEQFAALGAISQKHGADAGNYYDAFLQNAVRGGRQLGVTLTDAKGVLLAFPDILQKLQTKFGNTIDGNVKAQKALNAAFGDGAKALTASWGQADKLRKHINELGNTHGLDRSTEMAQKMADIWERLGAVWERIRVSLGMQLIPAISPLVEIAIAAGTQFAKWLDMFPNITRWLGYISTFTLGVAAAGAILNITLGMMRFILVGLRAGFKALIWLLNINARVLKIVTFFTKAYRITLLATAVALRFFRGAVLAASIAIANFNLKAKLMAAWTAICRVGIVAWNLVLGVGAIAMRAYGLATMFAGVAMQILLSPVTLIIIALAALALGVWYVIKNWDELKAALMEYAAFRWIIKIAGQVADTYAWAWDTLKAGWQSVVDFFSGLSPVESFLGFVDDIGSVFAGLWDWLKKSFTDSYNWIISKLNTIPGVDIELKTAPIPDDKSALPVPAGMSVPALPPGGINRQILHNQQNMNNNRKTEVREVNIYPPNGASFSSIMESQELAAG